MGGQRGKLVMFTLCINTVLFTHIDLTLFSFCLMGFNGAVQDNLLHCFTLLLYVSVQSQAKHTKVYHCLSLHCQAKKVLNLTYLWCCRCTFIFCTFIMFLSPINNVPLKRCKVHIWTIITSRVRL